MKVILTAVCIVLGADFCAWANIASKDYVEEQVNTRVDMSKESENVMAGKYTISGTIEVPTPDLPPAVK